MCMLAKAERDFHNQVDGMNCFVDFSQPFPPDTPVIAQWAHEQSARSGKDGGEA